jgi:hypothetical protein
MFPCSFPSHRCVSLLLPRALAAVLLLALVLFSADFALAQNRYVFVTPAQSVLAIEDGVLLEIRAVDASNRILTRETRSVLLTDTGSAIDGAGALVSLSAGRGYFYVASSVAETTTVMINDLSLTGFAVSSVQLTWLPGPTEAVIISSLGVASADVGTQLELRAEAFDSFGNLVTTENRAMFISANGSATVSALVLSSGRGSARLTDSVPERVTVTISFPANGTVLLSNNVQSVTFVSGQPARFELTGPATIYDAVKSISSNHLLLNDVVQVSIAAFDQFGNVADRSFSVTLQVNGTGSVVGPSLISMAGGHGIGSFTSGSPGTIRASLAGIGNATVTRFVDSTFYRDANFILSSPAPTKSSGDSVLVGSILFNLIPLLPTDVPPFLSGPQTGERGGAEQVGPHAFFPSLPPLPKPDGPRLALCFAKTKTYISLLFPFAVFLQGKQLADRRNGPGLDPGAQQHVCQSALFHQRHQRPRIGAHHLLDRRCSARVDH